MLAKYLQRVRAGGYTPSSNVIGEAPKAPTCSRSHSQDEAELELEPDPVLPPLLLLQPSRCSPQTFACGLFSVFSHGS